MLSVQPRVNMGHTSHHCLFTVYMCSCFVSIIARPVTWGIGTLSQPILCKFLSHLFKVLSVSTRGYAFQPSGWRACRTQLLVGNKTLHSKFVNHLILQLTLLIPWTQSFFAWLNFKHFGGKFLPLYGLIIIYIYLYNVPQSILLYSTGILSYLC